MRLETKRLLLRPFEENDAGDLYEYAKDSRVGPIAGWPVHTSLENSRKIICTVFAAPIVFPVVDKASGKVIGSAGFVGGYCPELPGPSDEIGYALSPAFWGGGLMPEAVEKLMEFGFEALGLNAIWCNHYNGNQKSKRVIEKCGFYYRFSKETEVTLMNERRLTHFYALTRREWEERRP